MPPFAENLEFGQLGESVIARWLRSRGSSVLPAYEKEFDTGKGPRLFTPHGQLVTPDLFVFPSRTFIEAKHKTVFTWYHRSGGWQTGIDGDHFHDYLKVQDETGSPVWLMFLHRTSVPDPIDRDGRPDCRWCRYSPAHTCAPDECPTGLFGAPLTFLKERIDHPSDKYGRHGMVYWKYETLLKDGKPLAALAELGDLLEAA